MATSILVRPPCRQWPGISHVLKLLVLALLLLSVGCAPGGDQGQPTAPSAPGPTVERQAIANLLALYQEAVVAEDSDCLHALLAPVVRSAGIQGWHVSGSPSALGSPWRSGSKARL